jgi:alanyl-tRNA synthetase
MLVGINEFLHWMTIQDAYGFALNSTEEQINKIRQRCDEKQAQQALKWAKHAEKQRLPSGEKLKKLCRKVCYGVLV